MKNLLLSTSITLALVFAAGSAAAQTIDRDRVNTIKQAPKPLDVKPAPKKDDARRTIILNGKPVTVGPPTPEQMRQSGEAVFAARTADRHKRGFVSAQGGSESAGRWSKSLVPVNTDLSAGLDKTVRSTGADSSACHSERVRVSGGKHSLRSFSLDYQDWLKPGVVLTAASVLDGGYQSPRGTRKPLTLSTTVRGGDLGSVTVDAPEVSTISNGLKSMLTGPLEDVYAQFDFDYQEVHTAEEINMHVDGAYSNGTFGVAGKLNFNDSEERKERTYLLHFEQNMYTVAVDPLYAQDIFVDQNQSTDGLVYLSSVSYGRRGAVLVTTKRDLSKAKGSIEASMNNILGKGHLKSGFDTIDMDEGITIQAILYGGDTDAAIKSVVNSINEGDLDIKEYLSTKSADPRYGAPISYELRNMYGERVGVRSAFERTTKTCVPGFDEEMKLRITLTDLVNVQSRDSDKRDDYGLFQHVTYTPKGRPARSSGQDIRKFANTHNDQFVLDGAIVLAENRLIFGKKERQLRVRQTSNRSGNINNSLVFDVSLSDVQDPATKLQIHTWLKEYTSGDDLVLEDMQRIDVPLKEVMLHIGSNGQSGLSFDRPFWQRGLKNVRDGKFFASGPNNISLWLTEGPNGTIEGPIVHGRQGAMAATWINFSKVE